MNTDQIRKETYKPRQKIVPQYSIRKSCLFLRAGEVYRSLGRPKRPDIVRFDPTEFGHLLARLSLPAWPRWQLLYCGAMVCDILAAIRRLRVPPRCA